MLKKTMVHTIRLNIAVVGYCGGGSKFEVSLGYIVRPCPKNNQMLLKEYLVIREQPKNVWRYKDHKTDSSSFIKNM